MSTSAQTALRALRWLAAALALVLLVVCFVLTTRAGLRLALAIGLPVYNGKIAGEVAIEGADGSLLGGFSLRGVVLSDRVGRRLVAADAITVAWSPWGLVRGQLRVDLLRLERPRVGLGGDFADLAPPGAEEEDLSSPPGPDLPLAIDVRLELRDGLVLAADGAPLVARASLDAEARAAGRAAIVKIREGQAELVGEHALRGLQLRARWTSPVAIVDDLRVRVGAAELVVPSARVDVRRLAVDARLRAEAMLAGLSAFLPQETVDALRPLGASLQLEAMIVGDPRDMSVDLQLASDAGARLTLVGSGAWEQVVRAELRADARIDLGPWTEGRLGVVRPTLELRGRGLEEERWALVGGLRCPGCDSLGEPTLELDGVIDAGREGLSFETSLSLAGLSAIAEVEAREGALRSLTWRLSAPELARPAGVARGLVPVVPEIHGGLSSRGHCRGPELRCLAAFELDDVRAVDTALDAARIDAEFQAAEVSQGTVAIAARGLRRGDLALDRAALALTVASGGPELFAPPLTAELEAAGVATSGDSARIDAGVVIIPRDEAGAGPELRADLRALELDYGDTTITLDGPARIIARDRRVEVDHLRLDLGRGRLALAGVADLDGVSDLRLDIDDLALATLGPLVPGLRPRGRASAAVRVQGRADAPTLQADLSIRRAGLRGRRIGDLRLVASLERGRAAVNLGVRGPLARRAIACGDVPLRVDLSQGTWSMARERAHAEVQVADLRLSRLAGLTGAEMTGLVDGFVRLTGERGAAPQLVGAWRGRAVAVEEVPVGDLRLELEHGEGQLRADLLLRRAGGRVRLDAEVPIALDLSRGAVQWQRDQDHYVRLRADGIDLSRQLDTLSQLGDDDRFVDGRAEVWAELSGPVGALELHTDVRADALRLDDMSFGSFYLETITRDGGTTVTLAGGGELGQLELKAQAPVGLDTTGPVWRRDGWYALDLKLGAVDLTGLRPLVGVAVDGQVSGHLGVAGLGARPRVHGSVRGDGLEYDGEAVGDLQARFGLREGTATLVASGRLGDHGDLRAELRVPVELDLAAPAVAWSPGQSAALHLDLTGVDRSVLEPFHALPADALLDLDVHVRADVDPARLRAQAALTGTIGREDIGATPISVRLDVGDRKQTLRAVGGALRLSLAADASVPALRRGEAELLRTPIRGELRARSNDLRYISALLPSAVHELTGALSAELAIRGELGDPVIRGQAGLRDGAITVVPLQQRFRGLSFDVVADGPKLQLTRFTATSGKGRLRATGAATLAAGGRLDGSADITLNSFPVVRPGLPQMTVDSRVRLAIDAQPEALAVAVEVAKTEIWVSDLTTRAPDPIPTNGKIEIVGGSAPTDEPPPAVNGDDDDPRAMSVSVHLKDPVHIQGPAMDMRWGGEVTSRSRGDETEVTGEFRSDRGRFELLGTMFTIERGRVFLPEDGVEIDPFIDLTAGAQTPEADVTVTLRGRLSRPELSLESRPPLTEPQIFSLLMTGSTDSEETEPGQAQASAAGLLVNFSNPTLARLAQQRLGIDRLKFGFADDLRQPVLTIGKHLSKSIYVETTYHHNAPIRHNRIEAQVEYRFAPKWAIETFFGDAAVGGLDVFWRHRFGRQDKKRR